MFSGDKGALLAIEPVASKTALAIAGKGPLMEISPMPFNPKGPEGSYIPKAIDSISGMSIAVGIRYS